MTQVQVDKLHFEENEAKLNFTTDSENENDLQKRESPKKKTLHQTKAKKKKTNLKLDNSIDQDFPEKCTDKNLIRKVEMNLDSDTEMHIYNDKFKILIKGQPAFTIAKRTWNLLLKKSKTINTASRLTDL